MTRRAGTLVLTIIGVATLALTMGANYLVTLVNDATDTLARAGIQSGSRLIAPLLSAALDNALRLGDGAMTGPVSRGDTATVGSLRRCGAGRAGRSRRPI